MTWISIKDRCPDEVNKQYLVRTLYGVDFATLFDSGDGTGNIYWGKNYPDQRFPMTVPITHWMEFKD